MDIMCVNSDFSLPLMDDIINEVNNVKFLLVADTRVIQSSAMNGSMEAWEN